MSAKPFVFDKVACLKVLDEIGKKVVAYKGREGYDVDTWLKKNIFPLDKRLNVDNEKTEALQDAILNFKFSVPVAQAVVEKPATPTATKPAAQPEVVKPTEAKK